MIKYFSFILLALCAISAKAQTEPKATLYGITTPTPTVRQVIDSIENADPASVVRVDNAVVLGFTLVHSPASGVPFVEEMKGRGISPRLQARLKTAKPGDKIIISNVKISANGGQAVTNKGMLYVLQ
jgi:hypothetical protein